MPKIWNNASLDAYSFRPLDDAPLTKESPVSATTGSYYGSPSRSPTSVRLQARGQRMLHAQSTTTGLESQRMPQETPDQSPKSGKKSARLKSMQSAMSFCEDDDDPTYSMAILPKDSDDSILTGASFTAASVTASRFGGTTQGLMGITKFKNESLPKIDPNLEPLATSPKGFGILQRTDLPLTQYKRLQVYHEHVHNESWAHIEKTLEEAKLKGEEAKASGESVGGKKVAIKVIDSDSAAAAAATGVGSTKLKKIIDEPPTDFYPAVKSEFEKRKDRYNRDLQEELRRSKSLYHSAHNPLKKGHEGRYKAPTTLLEEAEESARNRRPGKRQISKSPFSKPSASKQVPSKQVPSKQVSSPSATPAAPKPTPIPLFRHWMMDPTVGCNIFVYEDWDTPLAKFIYDPHRDHALNERKRRDLKFKARKHVRIMAKKRDSVLPMSSFLFGDGKIPLFQRKSDMFPCHYYSVEIMGECSGKIHIGACGIHPTKYPRLGSSGFAFDLPRTVLLYDGFLQYRPEDIRHEKQKIIKEPEYDKVGRRIIGGKAFIDKYRQAALWDGEVTSGDTVSVAIMKLKTDPEYMDMVVFLNGLQMTRNKFPISEMLCGGDLQTMYPVVDICGMTGKDVKVWLNPLATPPKVVLWSTYKGADKLAENEQNELADQLKAAFEKKK